MLTNSETMSIMDVKQIFGETMTQYLLDTDVCIELIKHNERVLDKVESVGADHCFVTEITIAELFYGAAKSGHPEHFDHIPNITLEDWAQKSKYKK